VLDRYLGGRVPDPGVLASASDLNIPAKDGVFICEHGAAKSVIAAAYFNKLAAERHLNFHAIARGLTPQPVESFDIPAPNDGYDVSRDAILVHVKALVDQLASTQ